MSSLAHASNRDRKINRRRSGMKVDGKSIFVLEEIKRKKALKIKLEREAKENAER